MTNDQFTLILNLARVGFVEAAKNTQNPVAVLSDCTGALVAGEKRLADLIAAEKPIRVTSASNSG